MTSLDLILALGGPLALIFAVGMGAWAASRRAGWVRWVAAIGGLAAIPVAIYGLGMRYRTPPPPEQRVLAPGIEYQRLVEDGPAVVHIVRIDLARPDLIPVATPPAEGKGVPAQRVLDFAVEQGAEVAMNTAFFHPFRSSSPFDYYPRTGDPTEPFGITMTDGVEFGANRFHRGTVYFSEDEASLDRMEDARWAVTGRTTLVRNGQPVPGNETTLAPRSAIGFDGTQLWFVAVDGRQPGYSEGITLGALGRLLASMQLEWAIEMDGGGSSTLVDTTGPTPRTLNCPIHTRLPCRDRPVAAQVGIKRVGS
ncbi:MAG: phosphodiester glycosidase family protein [Nannocystaceae bacterium]|nr:phosphodiester glycosidase family protein [Nannocystaceae bacterium]